jgi:hypothetical protein
MYNRHISVSWFVYKYGQWHHDSHMTGRAGVWEADDIVQFYIDSVCVFVCHRFSYHPFYFDFHSARVIFDVSSGFYFWIILHLNKITECLKMTTFKIVFTFDVFFIAETTMHCIYFDFHSARIIFDVSSGFYLWNINNTKADIC